MNKKLASCMFVVGALISWGIAGNDCDGACVERGADMSTILIWSTVGFLLMFFSQKENRNPLRLRRMAREFMGYLQW